MQEHRSFPSIVTWVVFNEGWGQYDTQQVVALAQSLDSSRLIDPASGWVDAEVSLLTTGPYLLRMLGNRAWLPESAHACEMQRSEHLRSPSQQ